MKTPDRVRVWCPHINVFNRVAAFNLTGMMHQVVRIGIRGWSASAPACLHRCARLGGIERDFAAHQFGAGMPAGARDRCAHPRQQFLHMERRSGSRRSASIPATFSCRLSRAVRISTGIFRPGSAPFPEHLAGQPVRLRQSGSK